MRHSPALLVAALSTLSVSSWAEPSDLYFGVDLFGTRNQFNYQYAGTGSDINYDSEGFKLVFGALLADDLRLQGYLQSEKFDEPPFDYSHERLTEIGLDLIKEFVVSPSFSPFIQGGIGFGAMDLDPYYYAQDSIGELSLKLGFGLMFRATQQVELLTGLDFEWRQWGDVDYYIGSYPYTVHMQTEDTNQRFYVGVNFLF